MIVFVIVTQSSLLTGYYSAAPSMLPLRTGEGVKGEGLRAAKPPANPHISSCPALREIDRKDA